jgi:hypothetical protein
LYNIAGVLPFLKIHGAQHGHTHTLKNTHAGTKRKTKKKKKRNFLNPERASHRLLAWSNHISGKNLGEKQISIKRNRTVEKNRVTLLVRMFYRWKELTD